MLDSDFFLKKKNIHTYPKNFRVPNRPKFVQILKQYKVESARVVAIFTFWKGIELLKYLEK